MAPVRNTDETLDGRIATYTGHTIQPLDPDPKDIHIEDIAHALSLACRFTGHVREFYSVAQHSVLCSMIVPPEYALMALLHDASEAYLSDIARPIKMVPEFGEVYRKFETRLEVAIAKKFDLDHPWHEEVKRADNVLLRTEQRDLMPPNFLHAGDEFLEGVITPWPSTEAEEVFLVRYALIKAGTDITKVAQAVGLSVVGAS